MYSFSTSIIFFIALVLLCSCKSIFGFMTVQVKRQAYYVPLTAALTTTMTTTPTDQLGLSNLPKHVGFIVDGNGRWAESKGLPRTIGHAQGASICHDVVKEVFQMGVDTVTLYLFSTENWLRPYEEIANIFLLLEKYLTEFRDYLNENRIAVKIIGQVHRLPEHLQKLLYEVGYNETMNENGDYVKRARTLCLAVSYGGRDDIVDACKSLMKAGISADDLTEDEVSLHTHTGRQGVPDPDLIIRTSGELRLSNFMLWQAAYTEFSSVDVLWPDFTAQQAREVILRASQRKRRFGKST